MCGITGFISKFERPVAEATGVVERMCRAIEHRGPDEQGILVEGKAALGMRRLAIIDLRTGQQPIKNETAELSIVFNGEIYNYLELKRDLESRGHIFRTNSDTETILHAFEEFGESCVDRLRGMFAFAIWNARDESLFIARDRVGKKPLFYALSKCGDLVFGSELKALFAHGDVVAEIDPAALDAFLTFGYVPEEFCIFRGVRKLLPGHSMVYKNGKVEIRRYWDIDLTPDPDLRTEEDYIELLREKLEESVRIRLISEVPLGAFLSGGVDSSAVVAMMARHSTQPVKTFSIGFDEDRFDETKYARIAAKKFGTEHREFMVTAEMIDIAEDLAGHFDEPFGDASALPTYMVSLMAREFVTVVLSGDGGDELFAGYERYAVDRRRSISARLPRPLRNGLRTAAEWMPHGAFGKNFLYNISLDPVDRYIDGISHFNDPRKKRLYSADFRASLNGAFGAGSSLFSKIAGQFDPGRPMDRLLYLDSKTYLPSDILTKVDRSSMAASLEVRSPLLDHELIELVSAMPARFKMNGSRSKYIFRKAMTGIVPDEILFRKKQGFGLPIEEWINTRLGNPIRETLLEPKTLERGYFDRQYIETLIDEHTRKRRDHSHALWMLWVLEIWQRKVLGGK